MREIRMLRTTWRKLETELRGGLRHRMMAKASGQLRLPAPVATAPVFDPTDERRLETGLWRGVRHRYRESRRQQLPPIAYRHRASCRLYTNLAMTPVTYTSELPWLGCFGVGHTCFSRCCATGKRQKPLVIHGHCCRRKVLASKGSWGVHVSMATGVITGPPHILGPQVLLYSTPSKQVMAWPQIARQGS